jgi:hypothetical protein
MTWPDPIVIVSQCFELGIQRQYNPSPILALSFSTGFMTAVFNQAIGWFREARHEQLATAGDARYLAIRVVLRDIQ